MCSSDLKPYETYFLFGRVLLFNYHPKVNKKEVHWSPVVVLNCDDEKSKFTILDEMNRVHVDVTVDQLKYIPTDDYFDKSSSSFSMWNKNHPLGFEKDHTVRSKCVYTDGTRSAELYEAKILKVNQKTCTLNLQFLDDGQEDFNVHPSCIEFTKKFRKYIQYSQESSGIHISEYVKNIIDNTPVVVIPAGKTPKQFSICLCIF